MHKELNIAIKINFYKEFEIFNRNKQFDIFLRNFKKNNKSKISELFYGISNTSLKCELCKFTINDYHEFIMLTFPLENVLEFKKSIKKINIIDCFEYDKREVKTEKNEEFCKQCYNLTNKYKSKKIMISPNILFINLCRRKNFALNVKLNFGENLNLKDFISSKDSPTFYELIGVITNNENNNFISFCKSFIDKKWYRYNDTEVNNSSFQEASSTGAPIILLYSSVGN